MSLVYDNLSGFLFSCTNKDIFRIKKFNLTNKIQLTFINRSGKEENGECAGIFFEINCIDQ